jgi:acetyl-CoA carboxylase biotin carboxyl carrier protein
MNQKEIKELVEFLVEKDIAEFELERGDIKIRIKRPQIAYATGIASGVPTGAASGVATYAASPASAPHASPLPSSASAPAAAAPAVASEEGVEIIKSPIVGTFYEAASPGAPPFIKRGDNVSAGQVLCIVEAMKLMNEIEAEKAGQIVDILVANGQPVEYGQPLFKIRTK